MIVNLVIRPYNNRGKILELMQKNQQMVLPLLGARVLDHRYPDLSELRTQMNTLSAELKIFEQQPPNLSHKRSLQLIARRQEAAYLRGCEQLLQKMVGELEALCNIDSNPMPSKTCLERLEKHGLVSSDLSPCRGRHNETHEIVFDFHINNLLDAYDFLNDFNQAK